MIDNYSVHVLQAVVHLVPNFVICHICQDTLHLFVHNVFAFVNYFVLQ